MFAYTSQWIHTGYYTRVVLGQPEVRCHVRGCAAWSWPHGAVVMDLPPPEALESTNPKLCCRDLRTRQEFNGKCHPGFLLHCPSVLHPSLHTLARAMHRDRLLIPFPTNDTHNCSDVNRLFYKTQQHSTHLHQNSIITHRINKILF